MYLQRVEMQGFKSFANKTVLEFLPPKGDKCGITAIVGPNGSGKSNIADAIRWVLGEQSMKLIRGKRAQDVIFNGSDKRSRSGFAEVSIYLNNESKKIKEIDYDEVIITRRLYRDGESEYLINKNKVRLQDILMLLAQANFGQRTYSVIGQGMVDAVLVASPKERKEFFDEAAGVKQYQLKREQSIRKLEASEDNLMQAELVLGELEPRMKGLSRQVRRLDERATLEKDLRELEFDYFGTLWSNLQTELKKIDERSKIVDVDRKTREKEIESLHKQLSGMETEEIKSQGLMELQKIYEEELEKRNLLREKEIQLRSTIQMEKTKAATAATPSLPMPLTKIIQEIENISNQHDKLIAAILKAKTLSEAQTASKKLGALGEQINDLLQELKAPGHKNNKTTKTSPEVPRLEKELAGLASKISGMAEALTNIQNKMQRWGEQESKKRGDFFELQKKLQGLQSELFEIDRHLSDHRVARARVETRRDTVKQESKEALGDESEKALKYVPKKKVDPQELSPALHKLRNQVAQLGAIDQAVVDEYKETKERFDFLTSQVDDLRKTKAQLEEMIGDLDEMIRKQSDQAFKLINAQFDKFFKQLFDGGTASLKKIEQEVEEEVIDQLEEEGISLNEDEGRSKKRKEQWLGLDIFANPPGKRVKTIHVLSGGERALTSIALICAILTTNPSPFVVLDEVDAALDEHNASKFATIIESLSHKTQFLLITHNRYTMEKSDVLYGVTMADDSTSHIISLKLEEAEGVTKQKKKT